MTWRGIASPSVAGTDHTQNQTSNVDAFIYNFEDSFLSTVNHMLVWYVSLV